MAWTPLKAVYIAQPRTIAKPATCSVRSSSDRRTCRNFARNGRTALTNRDYPVQSGARGRIYSGRNPSVPPSRRLPGVAEERRGFRGGGHLSSPAPLGLLDACDLLQGGYPLLDWRMCLEEAAEEAAVMLLRVVDAHRRDRVVEHLGRLVVGGDLLQRVDQADGVACCGSRPVAKAFGLGSSMT